MVNLQLIENSINPAALEVCRIILAAGYQAYLVGGCVRDLLLGATPKDWDITTNALPADIIAIFPKTYPTGIQHGTVTVSMNDNLFEVTTFRIEGKYTDGRRPEQVFFVQDIEQDLSRRDLTINAMAFDPINKKIIDPYNGMQDLQDGAIKAVGDSNLRFQEDGLRIMRAARFAARFGYKIEQQTFYGMMDNLSILKKVSMERIKDELCKILMASNEIYGLQLLLACNALEIVCPLLVSPETKLCILPYQNKCFGDLETRVAYLYCYCQTNDVKNELINLKFSNKEIKRVLFLLDLAERYQEFAQDGSVASYKNLLAHIKNSTPDTWEYTLDQFIKLCTAMGYNVTTSFAKFQNEIVLSRKEMDLDGNDLICVGIPAGPEIKKILDKCYQEILDNPERNEKYKLLRFVMYGSWE